MSDVISQESFDELALYFNGGGHLLTPDARRSAAERARILCACGLDALRRYTHRTGVNNLYGGRYFCSLVVSSCSLVDTHPA